jgi:hypothetical protein
MMFSSSLKESSEVFIKLDVPYEALFQLVVQLYTEDSNIAWGMVRGASTPLNPSKPRVPTLKNACAATYWKNISSFSVRDFTCRQLLFAKIIQYPYPHVPSDLPNTVTHYINLMQLSHLMMMPDNFRTKSSFS